MSSNSHWYVVGGLLGLLALATCGSSRKRLPALVARPKALMTLPPHHAPALGAAAASLVSPPQGIPANLAEALRAVAINTNAESPQDAADTILDPATARTLAERAVAAINAAGSVHVYLVAADDALLMESGITRVTFTVHEPNGNVSIKLVAIYDAWTQKLSLVRPYSTATKPTENAYDSAKEYAAYQMP